MDAVSNYTLVRTIRDALNGLTGIEIMALQKSKFFRLYLDAPLGSETDKRIALILTTKALDTVFELFPALQSSEIIQKTVCTVFGFVVDRLNRIKLFHLYKKGVITESQYIYERNKSHAATLVTLVNNMKGVTLRTLSVFISAQYPEFSSAIQRFASFIDERWRLDEVKAEKLVSRINDIVLNSLYFIEDSYRQVYQWICSQYNSVVKTIQDKKRSLQYA